jgi:hypothetical protein
VVVGSRSCLQNRLTASRQVAMFSWPLPTRPQVPKED